MPSVPNRNSQLFRAPPSLVQSLHWLWWFFTLSAGFQDLGDCFRNKKRLTTRIPSSSSKIHTLLNPNRNPLARRKLLNSLNIPLAPYKPLIPLVNMSLQKYRRSKKHDLNPGSKLVKQVPDEIMELILQRLNIFEYLAFRQVCRPWRALCKRCPPAPQLPWLLYNSHYPYYIQDQCFESCLSDPRIHNSPMLFHESRCIGSVEGWLIMVAIIHKISPVVHYLLNPITGSRVGLPPQSTISGLLRSNSVNSIGKAVASFDQSSLDHCLVACLFTNSLAFCRPIDESWTLIEAREGLFTDVEIIDGKLYGVTFSSTLMVFNIQGDTYTAERLVKLPSTWLFQSHLAKDVASKDLFIVYRRKDISNNIISFHVMKLECNKGDDPHCVPVYDLGDQTLFLSDVDTKIISSSSSNLSGSVDNRLKNCIYYSFGSGRNFGVFSLTEKSIKLLTPPGYYVSPFPEQRLFKESFVWFKPNPW